jgi:hypothetical protein
MQPNVIRYFIPWGRDQEALLKEFDAEVQLKVAVIDVMVV